jgi:hypothetical protein
MAIEVAAQKFLFSNQTSSSSGFDNFLSANDQDGTPKVPFYPNHLHDLESLWWVAVWMVFYHYFSKGTSSGKRPSFTLQDAAGQLYLAKKLFPSGLGRTSRQDGFRDRPTFQDLRDQLPPNKKVAHLGLEYLRGLLNNHYNAIEATYPLIDTGASTDVIYDEFIKTFSIIKSKSHDVVLDFIPEIHADLLKANKRRRSGSAAGAGDAQRMRT